MASTYAPVDALDYATEFIKGMPIERIQARVLDDANKHLWMAAPWRWTLGNTSANIPLVTDTQDYTLTAPADMLYPLYAYSSDGITTPNYIDIEPILPTTEIIKGIPERMAYMGSNTWRFYPKPQVTGSKSVVIQYKKIAPVVTVQNSYTAGTLVMDDEWFWVYQELVLWKAYAYADDTRAGSAQMTSDGKWQYTGKRGEAEAAIQYMREREKLPIFGYQLAPDPKVGNK